MGRQMAFWKYQDGVNPDDHHVYEAVCCEEGSLDGLALLPIEKILHRAAEIFSDYDKLDETSFESGKGSFSIFTTPQSVLFDCGWSMPPEELNKIIDVMLEFDCPLYDPQIETRFDGH